MRIPVAAALGVLTSTSAAADGRRNDGSVSPSTPLVKRIAARNGMLPPPTSTDRNLLATQSRGDNKPTFLNVHRRFHASSSGTAEEAVRSSASLQQSLGSASPQEHCDAAFLNCMPHTKCIGCFATMQADDVDWASVKPETPCSDVVKFLTANGKCTDLDSDQAERDVFCNTFDNCVIWDDADRGKKSGGGTDGGGGGGGDGNDPDGRARIDCDSLTSCDWEGKHAGFLGDGVCHDALFGCYNHQICNYDGGDCCPDTCKTSGDLVECGQDGYACRDPESESCDHSLTAKCKTEDPDSKPKPDPAADVTCPTDQAPYRLVQYDSWGDGWDSTEMTIKDGADAVIYKGGLKEGAEGTEYICLSTLSACYHVVVNGGIWGNEVSWEVKPLSFGAPSVADGGSPMQCDFSVGGDACPKTCDGPPEKGHENDPEYKSYQDLIGCIKEKCIIQVGACEQEASCEPCLLDDTPGYCFANDNYNALIDCAMCRCTEENERPTDYCEQKGPSGGGGLPPPPAPKDEHGAGPKQCNADETLKGSSAVMKFSQCSEVDTLAAMVTDYDENNFGALDTFEACAHAYATENMHGGKRALDCMRILSDAVKTPEAGAKPDTPTEAVAALANHLYSNAETFCSCASDAAKECPTCASFLHFKTLLFESLDACKALDEIDCDAWNEFFDPCKTKLIEKFGKIDFTNHNQCDYVSDSCGGAGPFPAFRRLDCGREIPKQAWDFYTTYDRGCLGGTSPSPDPQPRPGPAPHDPPKPTLPPPPPAAKPTNPVKPVPVPAPSSGPKPYVPPPDDSDNVSPHYSPSSPSSSSSSPSKPKKKRHIFAWFLFISAVAGGLWYKKRQSDSFDFVRYRRDRNWGGESEMYTGLSMDNSCSFEPPTLPPTPSAMEGNVA